MCPIISSGTLSDRGTESEGKRRKKRCWTEMLACSVRHFSAPFLQCTISVHHFSTPSTIQLFTCIVYLHLHHPISSSKRRQKKNHGPVSNTSCMNLNLTDPGSAFEQQRNWQLAQFCHVSLLSHHRISALGLVSLGPHASLVQHTDLFGSARVTDRQCAQPKETCLLCAPCSGRLFLGFFYLERDCVLERLTLNLNHS